MEFIKQIGINRNLDAEKEARIQEMQEAFERAIRATGLDKKNEYPRFVPNDTTIQLQ